jgi:regulator of replication initiation timing
MIKLVKLATSQLTIVVPNATPIFVPVVVPVIAPVVAPNRTTPVVLLLFTTLLFLAGCKPKQIITEKVVTIIDSSAVISLKNELHEKEIQVENLKTDFKHLRDENTRLMSEASTHTINYDTAAPVDPHTGKYPIASETITQTKSQIDKTIKEFEILQQEYNNEIYKLTRENQNLDYTLEALKEENISLKEKITPTTGFNFKLFFAGMIFGIVLILISIAFKNKILSLKIPSNL